MPKQESAPPMDTLAQLARELNEASDELTAYLRKREDELNQLKLGVEAEGGIQLAEPEAVAWQPPEAPGKEPIADLMEVAVLAYSRHGDRWRILVRTYDFPSGLDLANAQANDMAHIRDETPLLSASRDFRIRAVEQGALEELLRDIGNEARARLSALRALTRSEK